ncbi:MAG: PqqD family protein [Actinomycetota bacterium]
MSRISKQASGAIWFARVPGVLARNVGGDLILAAVGREGFQVLSATAGDVWRLLERPMTVEQLVETVSSVYSVSGEVISRDMDELLAHLLELGLIESVADPLEEVPEARA